MSPGSQVVRDANRTSNSREAWPGSGLRILPANSSVFCRDGSPTSAKFVKL